MEMFLFFGLLFVAAPIARAYARSIERGRPAAGPPDDETRKALQLAEQRLSDSEGRIAALEERIDFYEKLLANPETKRTS